MLTHSGVVLQLYKYGIDFSLNIFKTEINDLKTGGMLSSGPQEVLGSGGIYGTFLITPSLVIIVPW